MGSKIRAQESGVWGLCWSPSERGAEGCGGAGPVLEGRAQREGRSSRRQWGPVCCGQPSFREEAGGGSGGGVAGWGCSAPSDLPSSLTPRPGDPGRRVCSGAAGGPSSSPGLRPAGLTAAGHNRPGCGRRPPRSGAGRAWALAWPAKLRSAVRVGSRSRPRASGRRSGNLSRLETLFCLWKCFLIMKAICVHSPSYFADCPIRFWGFYFCFPFR